MTAAFVLNGKAIMDALPRKETNFRWSGVKRWVGSSAALDHF
jgi:hypothetical protein